MDPCQEAVQRWDCRAGFHSSDWTKARRIGYFEFMAKKDSAYTAALREVVADAIANDERERARKEASKARMEAQRSAPPPDVAAGLEAHLATLDTRLIGLREHERRGDALAAKLIKHVEKERAEVLAKLRASRSGK
jgi:hypothetical protein